MNRGRFLKIVTEAYGMQLPTVLTMFVEDAQDFLIYQVMLPDWFVEWRVVLSEKAAVAIACLQAPEDQLGKIGDAAVRTIKIRPVDAVACGLSRYNMRRPKVRAHMEARFSSLLPEMQSLAAEWWKETNHVS
jgi:hypothetical protein